MIPIRDENRPKTTPHITRILLIVNVIVFIPLLYYSFFPEDTMTSLFLESLFSNFTMIPADILQGKNLHTLFTSMFLHADIFHMSGNMLFLYIFGDNVEDALGHSHFLLFYLVCGLTASFAHILSLTTPMERVIPTLGASGAISGVMGAYFVMYPRARIQTLIVGYFIALVKVPAVVLLGFWFLLQMLYSWFDVGGGVAYWAHIGGFVIGLLLAFVLKKTRASTEEEVVWQTSLMHTED